MKTILLGDFHLGEAKDSKYIQAIQLDLIKQVCDYAKKHNIDVALQAGDWFDVRSGVTQETLMFMREQIRPLLAEAFRAIHVIPGNHDMHFKNKVIPNSVHENFGKDPLFKIYNEPETILLGSTMFDMIPWECKDNKDRIREFIENSASEYSMGHWELIGFDFYSGIPAHGGASKDFLSKYKLALSGHYHTASKKGNVQYLGTPYTITMNDCNDIRGFYVFDTEDGSMEFIPNNNMWHVKVNYSDIKTAEDVQRYKNKCVQLIVEKVDKNLDKILSEMESVCERIVIKNLEDFSLDVDASTGGEIEVKKVVQLIQEYVEGLDIEPEHKSLTSTLVDRLYLEASV